MKAISIVGGFYNERCFYPQFEDKNGSGFRACRAIRGVNSSVPIKFHTYTSNDQELSIYARTFNIEAVSYPSSQAISFYYDHPLRTPSIIPRPDLIISPAPIEMKADNILCYGMLEGNAKVSGRKVVYDPQSPVKPISFRDTGSTADQLAVVVNLKEAQRMAGNEDEKEIKSFFFEKEKVDVLIIKMGPKGAKVYTKNAAPQIVPVYKTPSVWPIGSGDVFAAIFAYQWMILDLPADKAADIASFSTAMYCNSKNYDSMVVERPKNITPLKITEFPKGMVYLAGPFFNYAQKWLINEAYCGLMGLGMQVFSPLHDVGEGTVEDGIAEKDIIGLEKCSIVFAVLDGLDAGTIFEIGYAIKMGIPVIAYVENESPGQLLMAEGTGCLIEHDFTTAMYKCLWLLAENE